MSFFSLDITRDYFLFGIELNVLADLWELTKYEGLAFLQEFYYYKEHYCDYPMVIYQSGIDSKTQPNLAPFLNFGMWKILLLKYGSFLKFMC